MSFPDPSSERVQKVMRDALASAAAMLQMMKESEQWQVLSDKHGLKIRVKEGTGEVQSVFLGSGEVNAPLDMVTGLLMDTKMKPQYDSVFEKAHLIEHLTPHIKVEKHEYWAPPLVAKRDFCVRLNKARLADGSVLLNGKSVQHERCPEDPKFLRGVIVSGGWLLQPVSASVTRCTLLACADLRGQLPAIIRAKLAEKQPEQIACIKPILGKMLRDLEKMTAEEKSAAQAKTQALVEEMPVYTDAELAEALKQGEKQAN